MPAEDYADVVEIDASTGQVTTRPLSVSEVDERDTLATAAQAEADAKSALCAQLIAIAQSAAGEYVDMLTTDQVRALAAILLWKAGGVNADGSIRTLEEWV